MSEVHASGGGVVSFRVRSGPPVGTGKGVVGRDGHKEQWASGGYMPVVGSSRS